MAVVETGGALVPTSGYTPTAGMASALRMYGGGVKSYAALYATQPNLRLVIRFLARNIASLGLHGFERIADNDRQRVDPASDLGQFLRSPTPDVPRPMTRHRWVRAIVTHLAAYDNA